MWSFLKKKKDETEKKLRDIIAPAPKVRVRDVAREVVKTAAKPLTIPQKKIKTSYQSQKSNIQQAKMFAKSNPIAKTDLTKSSVEYGYSPIVQAVKQRSIKPFFDVQNHKKNIIANISDPTNVYGAGTSKRLGKGVGILANKAMQSGASRQALNKIIQKGAPVAKTTMQKPLGQIIKKAPSKFGQKISNLTQKTKIPLYTKSVNNEVLKSSKGNLNMGHDFALKQARDESLGVEANASAMALMDDAIANGAWDRLDMYVNEFSPRFSKQGQNMQILSRWGRLTPAGALNYTQHMIDKVSKQSKKAIQFTPEAKKEIVELAKNVQKTVEGSREREIASALLMKKIAQQVPSTLGRKISTVQAMAQLLNPKTAIRNIVGNTAFGVGEAVSDVVGTPIDKAVSLVTGKRTKTLPSPSTIIQGFKKGAQEGYDEALLGIDTKSLPSQFDLPNAPTFKGKTGQAFEKLLALELKSTDRAFYQSAVDESLRQQMKLSGVAKPTSEMLEIAHNDGLYKTFQDDSVPARLFTGLKRALNIQKDFGLGDLVLKYPKTPGNLLARAIDYSPAGYGKALMELAQPAFGKEFNQKAFVEAISRGTVGSAGLVGMGAILGKLGIITGQASDDKDIRNLETAQGQGQFKINVSALMRLALTWDAENAKAKEGDRLLSYDWLQPFAVPLSMGANAVSDEKKSSSSVVMDSITAGADTLAEQPLVQGVKRMFGYGDLMGGLAETAKGVPASFVPTILSQVRQLTDNQKRQLTGGGKVQESMALVKNKIPGLSYTLPKQYNVLGQEQKMYQNGSNNLFNVFLNPAFVTKIEQTPGGKEVLDIFENSGETQMAPRTVPKSVTINGGKMELTPQQISQYQQYVGERTSVAFDTLANDPDFQKNSDEEKAKIMAGILTDINAVAKRRLFGDAGPDYQTEETYGEVENIQKSLAGSFEKATEKNVATRNLGQDFANQKVKDRQTKLFNDKMNKLKDRDEWKNASGEDREKFIKKLSSESKYHATAQMIAENVKDMNDDQKKSYLSDLKKAGILTKSVFEVYVASYNK